MPEVHVVDRLPRAGGGIGPRQPPRMAARPESESESDSGWAGHKTKTPMVIHKQWTMIMAMILACVASEHESHLKRSACQELLVAWSDPESLRGNGVSVFRHLSKVTQF